MLGKLFSSVSASPIEAIGNLLDKLFTSDEEYLDKEIMMQRVVQKATLVQVELNKIEAQHRSIFVAGWRPSIGWVCAAGLAYEFIAQPILTTLGYHAPLINISELKTLVLAMLGLGGLRTVEKFGGRSR